MKDMRTLRHQPSVFEGWENQAEMMASFMPHYASTDDVEMLWASSPEKTHVIYARYSADGYEGDAFVLFLRGREFFEVNGSHCSCYGLEGQWHPERTTLAAIRHRLIEGRLGHDYYGDGFRHTLADLIGVDLPENDED